MINKRKIIILISCILLIFCFGIILACKISSCEKKEENVRILFITPYEEIDSIDYTIGEDLILPKPKDREGFVFDYWSLDIDGKIIATKFTVKNYASEYVKDGTICFYAKWSSAYSLTFDLNGGEMNGDSVIYKLKSGSRITLPTAFKDHENFFGWSFEGEIYYADSVFIMPERNVTLRAEYGTELIKVTFISDKGNFTDYVFVEKGDKLLEPDFGIEKGYRYGGCYKDKEFTDCFDFQAETIFSDTTLFVKWIKVYTVTFETFGGTHIDPQQIDEGAVIQRPTLNPEKEDAVFRNWYSDKNCQFEFVFEKTPLYIDVIIYAGYDYLYFLEFDCNGGDLVSGNITSRKVRENETVVLPILKKEGYKFAGWNYEDKIYPPDKSFVMPSADVLLTAEWDNEVVQIEIYDWDDTFLYFGSAKKDVPFTLPIDEVPMFKLQEFSGFTILGEGQGNSVISPDKFIPTRNVAVKIVYDYESSFSALSDEQINDYFDLEFGDDEYWGFKTLTISYKSENVMKYSLLNFKMPVSYQGHIVSKVGINFFVSRFTGIYFPSSYTLIDKDAFKKMDSLKSVEFASESRLRKIGDYAFSCCYNLSEFQFPDSLAEIGDNVFEGSALKSVVFPSALRSLGKYVFKECAIESFFVRKGENPAFTARDGVLFSFKATEDSYLNELDELVYYPLAKNASDYEVPKEVKKIKGSAFYGTDKINSSLKNITFASGSKLDTVGEYAFAHLNSLKTIRFPSTLSAIYSYAFADIEAELIFSEGMKIFGCDIFNDDGKIYTSFGLYRGTVKIPSSVEKISVGVFNEYAGKEIIFGKGSSVSLIPDFAFYYAEELTSLYLPDSVTKIGDYAFYSCKSLKNFVLPKNLLSIGKRAFYNGWQTDQIEFPANLSFIGEYAFYTNDLNINRNMITRLDFPASLKTIERYAFYNFNNLTEVTFKKGSNITMGENVFKDPSIIQYIS